MITEDRPGSELLTVLEGLGCPRLLVVGDLMLDRYVIGTTARVSQEAPVLVLRAEREEDRLGGAANVAAMCSALEAEVTCAGIVGADAAGDRLAALLQDTVDAVCLRRDSTRPTTVKQRFIGGAAHRHPSQVLRVDYESTAEIGEAVTREWLETLLPLVAQHDAVVVSDYAKGLVTPGVVTALTRRAKELDVPLLVDPGAGRPLSHYSGATLIKPNRFEAAAILGAIPSLDDARATDWLPPVEAWPCEHLLITLDADGMLLCSPGGDPVHLKTQPREVSDITGAGDAVMAALAVAWGAGTEPLAAAWLGNVAGSIEVEHAGVTPITRAQLATELLQQAQVVNRKVLRLDEAARVCQHHRQCGQRIVVTNGCFDLLHYGHVTYLQQARRRGDVLVVAINSDRSVRRLKGPSRPVIEESQRAAMLAALACVDYVVVFDDETPHQVLKAIRPDVLVKGGTYRVDQVVGREVVESYGGEVDVLTLVEGISTTRIVESIQGQRAGQRRAG